MTFSFKPIEQNELIYLIKTYDLYLVRGLKVYSDDNFCIFSDSPNSEIIVAPGKKLFIPLIDILYIFKMD